MEAVVDIITNLGFPIAVCFFMGYYIKYTNDNHREDVNQLIASHKEELAEFSEAINENTKVLTTLVAKIGGEN